MKQKGIAHLFLLIVVIVVAIGAIGYLAYQNARLESQTGIVNTTSEKVDQQPTSLDNSGVTDNWNVYTNQETGFSYKYPDNLFYVVNPNGPANTPQEGRIQLRFYEEQSKANKCKEELKEHTNCTIREKFGINVQTYPISGNLDKDLDRFALAKTSMIAEYEGVEWTLVAGGTTGAAVGHTAWSVQNGKLIMLDFWQYPVDQSEYNTYNPLKNDLSNKILSTFTLTE